MRPKICVLMSTYNGHKYIREQIDSVLNQQDVEVRLLIRDDFSTDDTVSILKEYASKDNRVKYYIGENVGPCQSFFDLIKKAGEFEFYAFCDQDDIWEREKLKTAIVKLNELDSRKPALYFSNLKVVDSVLNFNHYAFSKTINTSERYLGLVDFFAVGCTEVFNIQAKKLLEKHLSVNCLMHDNWLFLICNFFGQVIYDHDSYINYRQHGNNVIGNSVSKMKLLKQRIIRLFDYSQQPRYKNAVLLYNEFRDLLEEDDKYRLIKIVDYKKSFLNRLKLLIDFQIHASTIVRDLRYRVLILLGVI